MLRAPDGKMRIDMGATSIITDPSSQKAMVLDHIKQTAHMVPLQPPQTPGMPQLPGGLPALPKGMKPAQVEDLGKGFIEGHEVEGKKYTIHPPDLPTAPKPPALPGMPAVPQAPHAPQMPTVAEIWSSTKTQMPVLTKVTGPFGQQVTHCKPGAAAEPPPPPAKFEVPHGYKLT
jgi:hypothetical protein